eukprot:3693676-Rhodomonas_salina.1
MSDASPALASASKERDEFVTLPKGCASGDLSMGDLNTGPVDVSVPAGTSLPTTNVSSELVTLQLALLTKDAGCDTICDVFDESNWVFWLLNSGSTKKIEAPASMSMRAEKPSVTDVRDPARGIP